MTAGIHGVTGRDLRNTVLFAGFVYLVFKFVALISGLLLTFSVAVIIALVLDPAVSWLAKRRIPRHMSAAVLAILVIAIAALTLALVLPPASKQLGELGKQFPGNADKVSGAVRNLLRDYPSVSNLIPKHLQIDGKSLGQIGKVLLGGATKATIGVFQALAGGFLIFIFTIYLLADPKSLVDDALRGLGPGTRRKAIAAGAKLSVQIRAWAFGRLIGMAFIFIATWGALAVIGIKQAFLFAVIAGLLQVIPVIGPLVAAVPPIVVGLLQDPRLALFAIIAMMVIQQIDDNLLTPFIMSRKLSLHPVKAMFAIIVMGGLFGIVGMFLATPAAVAAGIIYEEFYIRADSETIGEGLHDHIG